MLWPGRDLAWKEVGRRIYREYQDDPLGLWAAALAFYAVLSLFPFLVALVAIVGLILDPGSIARLVSSLHGVVPGEAMQLISSRLNALARSHNTTLLTIGFVAAIWSASRVAATLITLLNHVYQVKESRSWWKQQLLAIAVTLAAGLAALIGVLVMFGVPFLQSLLGSWFVYVAWLRIVVAAMAMMVAWALLYRFLPNVEQPRFRVITPGAVVGVLLWLLASWLFSVYVTHFGNYNAVYGAIGGVIVLLTWMFISSFVILLGAEINRVLAPDDEQTRRRERRKKHGLSPDAAAPAPRRRGWPPPPPHPPEPPPARP